MHQNDIVAYAEKIKHTGYHRIDARPNYVVQPDDGDIIITLKAFANIRIPTPYISDIHAILRCLHQGRAYRLACDPSNNTIHTQNHLYSYHDRPEYITLTDHYWTPYGQRALRTRHIPNIRINTMTLSDIIEQGRAHMQAHLPFIFRDPDIHYDFTGILGTQYPFEHRPNITCQYIIRAFQATKHIHVNICLCHDEVEIHDTDFHVHIHQLHQIPHAFDRSMRALMSDIGSEPTLYLPQHSQHQSIQFLRHIQQYIDQKTLLPTLRTCVEHLREHYDFIPTQSPST